jgi:transposase
MNLPPNPPKDGGEKPIDYSKLEYHPLAEAFELISGDEYTAFKEDIRKNGLREQITLFDGKILDGRNRHRACNDLGYKLKSENFKHYTGRFPAEFVISANILRRHLDASQRALHIARLATNKLGANQHTIGNLTAEAAAKLAGVSKASVEKAKAIYQNGSDELQTAVRTGKLKLGAIKTEDLALPKDQQLAAIVKRKADAEVAAAAARKGTTKAPKVPAANQAMLDVDTVKAKWRGFDKMQKEAFVTAFQNDISELLGEIVKKQQMVGIAA